MVFANKTQPDQTQTVTLNAHTFLLNGGHFEISFKTSNIDSTVLIEAVFPSEAKKMQQENLKSQKQLTLQPHQGDCTVVVCSGHLPRWRTNSDLSGFEEMSGATVAVFSVVFCFVLFPLKDSSVKK